jgi:predicted nucleic acid-binding protein
VRTVFADTFFYLALLSRDDRQRERVKAVADTLRARTVTTDWILVEVANALADPSSRALFTALAANLRSNLLVEVVQTNPSLQRRGEELYAARSDKGWSLTDCISFVVMTEHCLNEALTADHHFEQAGFVALLK